VDVELLIGRALGLARAKALALALRPLPLGSAYRIARRHGRRTFRRRRPDLQAHADEMRSRLNATGEDVDRWLGLYFELASSEKLEAHVYHRFRQRDVDRVLQIRGLSSLDDALARGNGAVLYSGHVMGHFTFFVALALHGIPLTILGFPDDVEQWVAQRRDAFMERRLGAELLRMQSGSFDVAIRALHALRQNRIVLIEIDQTRSRHRITTEFLGRTGSFPVGPALIADAGRAPLVPFWIHRPAEWSPQIAEIGEPLYVRGDVEGATRACAAALETSIRRDPPSWLPWLFSRKLVWEPADRSGGSDPQAADQSPTDSP
jgi:KDO2-lipid IV(A) lauroyltransferase